MIWVGLSSGSDYKCVVPAFAFKIYQLVQIMLRLYTSKVIETFEGWKLCRHSAGCSAILLYWWSYRSFCARQCCKNDKFWHAGQKSLMAWPNLWLINIGVQKFFQIWSCQRSIQSWWKNSRVLLTFNFKKLEPYYERSFCPFPFGWRNSLNLISDCLPLNIEDVLYLHWMTIDSWHLLKQTWTNATPNHWNLIHRNYINSCMGISIRWPISFGWWYWETSKIHKWSS